MRAYSMDLRERALLDSDAGMKAADVAAKYRVSDRSLIDATSPNGLPWRTMRAPSTPAGSRSGMSH